MPLRRQRCGLSISIPHWDGTSGIPHGRLAKFGKVRRQTRPCVGERNATKSISIRAFPKPIVMRATHSPVSPASSKPVTSFMPSTARHATTPVVRVAAKPGCRCSHRRPCSSISLACPLGSTSIDLVDRRGRRTLRKRYARVQGHAQPHHGEGCRCALHFTGCRIIWLAQGAARRQNPGRRRAAHRIPPERHQHAGLPQPAAPSAQPQ